ncbi:MAG: LysR family transcriptional regulator [Sutterellaceae bacterium]|nr:LysR family transcriptional regulator [Burkholderiaceae bacterium]MCX8005665.1 LysR family transcriptional regulator [Burkholderiaceae bacterium]MDW8429842.1 LysR family transcriptional regulator [Sutterellaceae bacterium]
MAAPFDLDDLRAFRAVAELRSFRRAAEAVHLSQPAFSRRIEKLERALGARLLERSTRHVSLTATGHEFARRTAQWLDEIDAALLSLRGLSLARSGEVAVACISTAVYYYLPRAIERLRARHPRIRVRVRDGNGAEVLEWVARGEADFGIDFLGSQAPDIEFQPLLEDPFVIACRKDHALARRRSVRWAELSQHDIVGVGRASGNRVLLDQALARTDVRLQPAYEADHVGSLLGLVEAGLGVGVVPSLALPARGHPRLTTVALVEPTVTRQVGLIRRRARPLAPAAQALYDEIRALQGVARQRRRTPC